MDSIAPAMGAIVLAGGGSHRMGCDKALVELDGIPLIVHVLRTLHSVSSISSTVITGRANLHDSRTQTTIGRDSPITAAAPRGEPPCPSTPVERRTHFLTGNPEPTPNLAKVRFIPDDFPDTGPLGGLITGLSHTGAHYSLVVGCDMPRLQTALLARLLELAPKHDAVVPVWEGKSQVLCAVYSREVLTAAGNCLHDGFRSIQALLSRLQDVYMMDEEDVRRYDQSGQTFVNVNSPEDLRSVQESLGHCPL